MQTPQRSGNNNPPRSPAKQLGQQTASLGASTLSATTGGCKGLFDPLKVYVRVRPFTATEKKKLFSPGSTPTSEGTVLFGESPLTYFSQEEAAAVRMKDNTVHLTMPSRGSTPFTFDDVFWSNTDIPMKANELDDEGREGVKEYASQQTVFESVGLPLVENALMGYNSALIAYGQTGSGKTHSIFGPGAEGTPTSCGVARVRRSSHSSSANSTPRTPTSAAAMPALDDADERGLIPRVCDELFTRLNGRLGTSAEVHTVTMSMWELYLEDVYDLLQSRKKLAVRQDTPSSFCVVGQREVPVRSYSEVLDLIKDGECLRTTAATAMNSRSSRAHTLFQLKITTQSKVGVKVAKVVLADLAGCERIKVAKTDKGTALDEACNINLSLLSLGNCIEAAVQRSKQGKGTENMGEFRQSVLTKLLKEFIGGNSRTAIMCTIAPTLADSHLSMQALRFANRAKQIQNHATVNLQLTKSVADLSISGMDWEVAGVREAYALKVDLLKKECSVEMSRVGAKRLYMTAYQRVADLRAEREELLKGPHVDPLATAAGPSMRTRILQLERALEAATVDLQDAQRVKEDLDAQLLQLCRDSQNVLLDREALEQEVNTLRLSLADQVNEQADAVLQHEIERDALERATVAKLDQQKRAFEEVVEQLQRNIAVITANATKQLADQVDLREKALQVAAGRAAEMMNLVHEEEAARCRSVYEEGAELLNLLGSKHAGMAALVTKQSESRVEGAVAEVEARLGAAVSGLTAKLDAARQTTAEAAEASKKQSAAWDAERRRFVATIQQGSAVQEELRHQVAKEGKAGAALASQCTQVRDALSAALAAFAQHSLAAAEPSLPPPSRSVSVAMGSEDIAEFLEKSNVASSSPSPRRGVAPLSERSATLTNMAL